MDWPRERGGRVELGLDSQGERGTCLPSFDRVEMKPIGRGIIPEMRSL